MYINYITILYELVEHIKHNQLYIYILQKLIYNNHTNKKSGKFVVSLCTTYY